MNSSSLLASQILASATVMDKMFTYKVKYKRVPSIAFGIVHEGEIIFSQGYGYSNLETKTSATEHTIYRIASISKVFTGIAILQLVEQEKIRLDDKVHKHLAWFASPNDKNLGHITIRQLLTHTSGLDRDGNTMHWVDGNFPTIEQIKNFIREQGGTVYQPLEKWKYSNIAYAILGEIIKVVSGINYEKYIQQNIITKSNLSSTSSTLTDKIKNNLAIGYSKDIAGKERTPFSQYETNGMAPATGLSSNVVDLCNLIAKLFDGNNQLFSDEIKREMRRIQWAGDEKNADRALFLHTWKHDGKRYFGHSGAFQGFKSNISIDFDRKIGVVVLTNAIDVDAIEFSDGIFATIDYITQHWEEFTDNKIEGEPSIYEGTYASIWGDTEVMAINSGLILSDAGASNPLSEINILSSQERHIFKITAGNGLGNVGELVKFVFNEKGNATNILIGANPNEKLS